MTEKKKMLSGEYYNSRDTELLEMYHRARKLMTQLNSLSTKEINKREEILTELLHFKGEGVWIESPFYCDYGENISIGANSFVNMGCIFLDNNEIKIGDNALIGPKVQLYTASHPLRSEERFIPVNERINGQGPYKTKAKPIRIGDNVWIGGNVVVIAGVTIGNNVTIGAGSVVFEDVPDDVLAMGNPCKVVKKL